MSIITKELQQRPVSQFIEKASDILANHNPILNLFKNYSRFPSQLAEKSLIEYNIKAIIANLTLSKAIFNIAYGVLFGWTLPISSIVSAAIFGYIYWDTSFDLNKDLGQEISQRSGSSQLKFGNNLLWKVIGCNQNGDLSAFPRS